MPDAFDRFLSLIGLKSRRQTPTGNNLKSRNKTQPITPPEWNNIVQHRYEKVDILMKCLDHFGYKNYSINDKNRPGIQIWLPDDKVLTDDQVRKIHWEYLKVHSKENADDSD